MSLYIRVLTSFWTHRKTARLKARLGNDALWIPVRLWSYAAENQPDGCFKDYSPEEIAVLIGYQGDAQAMLQALLQAGLLDPDPLRIHGWEEHNGFHNSFARRATKAARARWKAYRSRRRDEMIVQDSTVHDASNASSNASNASRIAQASDIYDLYPRKQGKKAALKAITIALKTEPFDKIMERTKAYALATQSWPADKRQYIPHPETWYNQGRYDDDPTTWERKGDGGNSSPAQPKVSAITIEKQIGILEARMNRHNGNYQNGHIGVTPEERAEFLAMRTQLEGLQNDLLAIGKRI